MIAARIGWLARPWFLTAVALLAVNDHVLKAMWPGWLTGKLSDFAGLAAIATLFAVLVGRSWAVTLAGLGFVALKTVPGVAELAAPLLGGVTLRDATDLVALAVLPGVWLLLKPADADARRRDRRGLAALGLIAGVLAVSATSAPPPTHVEDLGFTDGAFHAAVYTRERNDVSWLSSRDGGLTWARSSDPGELPEQVRIEPDGVQACAPDEVCYRGFPEPRRLQLQRREPRGDWVADGEVRWTPTVASSSFGYLPLLAINPLASDEVVIAQDDRCFVRLADRQWREVDLITPANDPAWLNVWVRLRNAPGGTLIVGIVVGAATAAVFMLAIWIAPRLRRTRLR